MHMLQRLPITPIMKSPAWTSAAKPLALLLACAVPAAAPAVPQHPADSARAHPATSARTNALAGESDAMRIEACTTRATKLLDRLAAGDYAGATADFDPKMQAELGAGKLGEMWQRLGDQAGKLQGHGTPQGALYSGLGLVSVPLLFANATLNAQIACDADGRISGLYMRPVNNAVAPPTSP